MKNYIIMDTCDVILTRLSDGKKALDTTTTLANINQTVDENNLQAGIGGTTIAKISTNKQITVDVTDALWSLEHLELSQGVRINPTGTATVDVKDVATFTGTSGTIAALVSTPAVTKAQVMANGVWVEVAVEDGVFTLPTGVDTSCPTIQVIYQKTVTGESLKFDSTKFSENYKMQLYTIAYDPETMEVVKDVYIVFDNVSPSGNFSLNFQLGTAITPEMQFQVLKPKCGTELGQITLVDRVPTV